LVDCDVNWADPSCRRNVVLQNIIEQMYSLIRRELGILQPLAAERLVDEARGLSEAILSTEGEQQTKVIVNWLMERKFLREDIPYSLVTENLSRFQVHINLVESFQPKMIRAPMFIWSAQESLSGIKTSDKNWGMYTSGMVVEELIAGGHYAVMYPPSVYVLAEQLGKRLRDFQVEQNVLPVLVDEFRAGDIASASP
jgi:hypothetical protein